MIDQVGVGPARAAAFARMGVEDAGDLLFLAPRRIAHGSDVSTIADALARPSSEVTITGRVERASLQRFGRRATLRVVVRDGTGSLTALFYNQPWLLKRFPVDSEVTLRGVLSRAGEIRSPKIGSESRPLAGAGEIALEYPAPEGVSPAFVARLVRELARSAHELVRDPVDRRHLDRHGLCTLGAAVRDLHAPPSEAAFVAARRRMTLERLLVLAARLGARRLDAASRHALAIDVDIDVDREILARFPFRFTAAQARVAAELRRDLARAQPMRRLLQGDVGSGKTALGLYAALLTARARGQTAFLAPTELLAEQHWIGLARVLESAGLRSALVTGSLRPGERADVLARLERGEIDVAFGTHALFSADVEYSRLALCVIDEQHRFGVAQRAELLSKGRDVHALLMTATPIPRTQALALYGDLDTSVLDEKPPGRGSVTTHWVRGQEKRRVEKLILERVKAGERVYWVVPRIGAGEEADGAVDARSMSAEVRFERLCASQLEPFGVELVHGRLSAAERAARLERFRSGAVRTLVATTVVEVGVDVPEATVIVIESAERLGLAQLHQLRGRVGRGSRPSWCWLFGSPSGAARFAVLERTTDGFVIAEEDLRQRGMGDLFGLRQAGINTEGLESLEADLDLLLFARRIVGEDPAAYATYAALARAHDGVHVP